MAQSPEPGFIFLFFFWTRSRTSHFPSCLAYPPHLSAIKPAQTLLHLAKWLRFRWYSWSLKRACFPPLLTCPMSAVEYLPHNIHLLLIMPLSYRDRPPAFSVHRVFLCKCIHVGLNKCLPPALRHELTSERLSRRYNIIYAFFFFFFFFFCKAIIVAAVLSPPHAFLIKDCMRVFFFKLAQVLWSPFPLSVYKLQVLQHFPLVRECLQPTNKGRVQTTQRQRMPPFWCQWWREGSQNWENWWQMGGRRNHGGSLKTGLSGWSRAGQLVSQ